MLPTPHSRALRRFSRCARLLIPLLGLGIWACGGPVGEPASSREPRVEEPALQPLHEEEAPDLDQTLAAVRTALQESPADPDLHFEEGRVLQQAGRPEEAVAAWRSTVDHDPNHGPAHARLAAVLALLGHREAAREHLRAARVLGAPAPAALEVLLGDLEHPGIVVSPRDPVSVPVVETAVRVDRAPPGVQSGETSIVASPEGELVAAWMETRRDVVPVKDPESEELAATTRVVTAVSADDGRTWKEQILRAPDAGDGPLNVEGDPMTAYDPRSGDFWAGGISFFDDRDLYVARKEAGAASFESATSAAANRLGRPDKGLLAAGPPPRTPSKTPVSRTHLYLTDQLGLQVSRDGGTTWTRPKPLFGRFGPLPRVGPDGTLYAMSWDGEDTIYLQRSLDGGDRLSPPVVVANRLDVWPISSGDRFPGRFRVPPLAYFAVDPVDSALYCVYVDTVALADGEADVDLFFTRSFDRGRSWSAPRPIPFGGGRGDQFLPWIEVDTGGRLHLLFYDSRQFEQRDDQENGRLDVYYAFSDDRGESWTEIRLTDRSFATEDAFWTTMGGQFLGDYLGLAVTGGTAHPLYAVAVDGDLDIYTRTLDFRTGSPPATPEPPRNLQIEQLSPTELRVSWEPTPPDTRVSLQRSFPGQRFAALELLPPGVHSLVVDGLEPGRPVSFRAATRSWAGASDWSPTVSRTPLAPEQRTCRADEHALCLLDERFRVEAHWRDPFNGGEGLAHAVPLVLLRGTRSKNTGTFWFFNRRNIELVVKILDGRPVNGHLWAFYGALSNVEYWVSVVDTETGATRVYYNPPGNLCGLGDVQAFEIPRPDSATAPHRDSISSRRPTDDDRPHPRTFPLETSPGRTESPTNLEPDSGVVSSQTCLPGLERLCLQRRRFQVRVLWTDLRTGHTGVAQAIPGTDDSGYFWFFEPDNVELVVKILDAREVNGHFWLFWGGLSDVQYTILVTDFASHRGTFVVRNEAFNICGGAVTEVL